MIVSRETLLQSIPVKLPPILPLTTNASSWLLHLPRFCPTPNRTVFQQIFQTHPPTQHALYLYGKKVLENRYSQMFVTHASVGSTYKYSGTARPCHVLGGHNDDHSQEEPHPEQQFLLDLCLVCNILYQKLAQEGVVHTTDDGVGMVDPPAGSCPDPADHHPYNCCLVNWYQPHHHIGLHADDEKELNPSIPIVSLSWGGPRRFLLRPKASLDKNKLSQLWQFKSNNSNNNNLAYFEIELKDGDLLFMGGKCQQEFKHEIPKVRKTKDGLVGPRISWTLRSMIPPSRPLPQHTAHTAQSSLSKIVLASKAASLGKRNHTDHEQSLQEQEDDYEVILATPMSDDRQTPTIRRRRIDDSL